jgi:hypothetical protein
MNGPLSAYETRVSRDYCASPIFGLQSRTRVQGNSKQLAIRMLIAPPIDHLLRQRYQWVAGRCLQTGARSGNDEPHAVPISPAPDERQSIALLSVGDGPQSPPLERNPPGFRAFLIVREERLEADSVSQPPVLPRLSDRTTDQWTLQPDQQSAYAK